MAAKRSSSRRLTRRPTLVGDEDSVLDDPKLSNLAETHIGALSKLFAIPLPIILATMVALSSIQATELKVGPLTVPRAYAEYVARTFLLLTYAQCCVHLLALLAVTEKSKRPDVLWQTFAFHPGPLNPFFGVITNNEDVGHIRRFFRYSLFMGRCTQLAIGLILGFSGGFRPGYSAGIVSHWYRLGSYFVWPVSGAISAEWNKRANEIVRYYIAAYGYWDNLFDALYLILHTVMTVGIVTAVLYIIERLTSDTRRMITAMASMAVGSVAGWVCGLVLWTLTKMSLPLP
ncbi:hypothetical protein B5K05_04035 [Rhizobium phaseoli]|uniref:hypothetical protein n=1 Tax=Rhizobium phaseoli TaxID=396 RepID=UPI000E0E03E0|nr:hypothetical protein [Rhizobium phaseoli]RDJ17251.1 hypothetical protein B5K04_04015 [Rhizobium phaseoli]RDJ18844.1 hypothetical protein B5K05_04035 [Rhizobium phaseoli]